MDAHRRLPRRLLSREFVEDESFLAASHRGWESLSPGGAFESDDLTIWEGISGSTRSRTLREREAVGNLQFGLDGMSEGVEVTDDV